MRVLIATEHASAEFGGEAALPLHYFRVLRRRGVPVWLVTHARTRDELTALYGNDPHIVYVEDSWIHKLLWQIGRRMPARIAYFTAGFLSRLAVQIEQRRIVRRLVTVEGIDIVHQPMPVSPREPSMMFGFGVPVVIGPMNGGMEFPAGFRRERGAVERMLLNAGRWSAAALNAAMPGKRLAGLLLVANERTRQALPRGLAGRVVELVENGVDLTVWRPPPEVGPRANSSTTFVFLGRLVDWKAVDLLIEAFGRAAQQAPMRLMVIGDGAERASLESLARNAGLLASSAGDAGKATFTGWMPQHACAEALARADALVLPSLLECGGAVVLEAMAMAKPVIATAWGGPLDYLDPSCGILVQPASREALVQGLSAAMVQLASNGQQCAEMGARGREKVLRDYDWEVKVDAVLRLYDGLRQGTLAVAARS